MRRYPQDFEKPTEYAKRPREEINTMIREVGDAQGRKEEWCGNTKVIKLEGGRIEIWRIFRVSKKDT